MGPTCHTLPFIYPFHLHSLSPTYPIAPTPLPRAPASAPPARPSPLSIRGGRARAGAASCRSISHDTRQRRRRQSGARQLVFRPPLSLSHRCRALYMADDDETSGSATSGGDGHGGVPQSSCASRIWRRQAPASPAPGCGSAFSLPPTAAARRQCSFPPPSLPPQVVGLASGSPGPAPRPRVACVRYDAGFGVGARRTGCPVCFRVPRCG
jgi:hypothetical protein